MWVILLLVWAVHAQDPFFRNFTSPTAVGVGNEIVMPYAIGTVTEGKFTVWQLEPPFYENLPVVKTRAREVNAHVTGGVASVHIPMLVGMTRVGVEFDGPGTAQIYRDITEERATYAEDVAKHPGVVEFAKKAAGSLHNDVYIVGTMWRARNDIEFTGSGKNIVMFGSSGPLIFGAYDELTRDRRNGVFAVDPLLITKFTDE